MHSMLAIQKQFKFSKALSALGEVPSIPAKLPIHHRVHSSLDQVLVGELAQHLSTVELDQVLPQHGTWDLARFLVGVLDLVQDLLPALPTLWGFPVP